MVRLEARARSSPRVARRNARFSEGASRLTTFLPGWFPVAILPFSAPLKRFIPLPLGLPSSPVPEGDAERAAERDACGILRDGPSAPGTPGPRLAALLPGLLPPIFSLLMLVPFCNAKVVKNTYI